MTQIRLRPSRMQIRRQSVRWIIIHDTYELYDVPEAKIDNQAYQMYGLFKGVLERKEPDINYHYVIDKIKDDYVPIVTRPTVYLCDWPDIPNEINNRAIHVALLGSYDLRLPEKRTYEILAYRLLNPMMKEFNIKPGKIKLHKEVSNDEDSSCPGDFLSKDIIISMVRRFVIK
jgi:hypothetical protein